MKRLGLRNIPENGLTIAQVRALLPELPPPILRCKIQGTVFNIYKVKGWFDSRLYDQHLYKLLLTARESFSVYDRPLLDKYDPKSAIYLSRAQYRLFSCPVEEWLCVRLVPGRGKVYSTGELDFFNYRGKKVEHWLQKKFFRKGENHLDYVASSSGMCSIPPYLTDEKPEGALSLNFPDKLTKTAFSYAIINLLFVKEYLEPLSYRYLTGNILNVLVDKALTVGINGKKMGTAFTPAHEFLNLKNPKEIKLDRRTAHYYVYRFPAYFLNVRQLIKVLLELIEKGILTKDAMRYYLSAELTIQDLSLDASLLINKLRNLYKLLTVDGKIEGLSITGEELRKILDKKVEDGPELKITKVEFVKESVVNLLETAGMTLY